MLTREAFLQHVPMGEDVTVPELGGKVCVRVMSGRDRDAFHAAVSASGEVPKPGHFRALLVVFTATDEHGRRLFADDDAQALYDVDPDILEPIAAVAIRLNRLGPGAQEEALKNSSAAQSGDSGFASPPISESP